MPKQEIIIIHIKDLMYPALDMAREWTDIVNIRIKRLLRNDEVHGVTTGY